MIWRKELTVMMLFVIFKGKCFVCGHVLVNATDKGYFPNAYLYICCLLFHFSSESVPEICQSWPEKNNISTALGCIH